MAATNNQNNWYGGEFVNGRFSNDFVLFPGSTFDSPYGTDIDADLAALEKEYGPNDSGYFSSENFDSIPDKNVKKVEDLPFVWCQHGKEEYIYSSNTAASTIAHNGSAYAGDDNRKAPTVEAASSNHPNSERSTIRTHKRKHHKRSSKSSSSKKYKSTSPSRLEYFESYNIESWLQANGDDETPAYRLLQPTKHHETASDNY